MADCNPPDPPPLLREPPRRFPTNAERGKAERAGVEREQANAWDFLFVHGCIPGCLILIVVSLAAACLVLGSPDDRLPLLVVLAATLR